MKLLRVATCLLPLFFATQCSCSWLWWWKKKPAYTKGIFQVRVEPWFGKDVQVRALAFENDDNSRGELVANHLVGPDGEVSFLLPMERKYIVLAWADMDRNGKRGLDEPSATVRGLSPLDVNEPQITPHVITLPGEGVPRPRARHGTLQPAAPAGDGELDTLKQQARQALELHAPRLVTPPAP
jgi:hypothetical protein